MNYYSFMLILASIPMHYYSTYILASITMHYSCDKHGKVIYYNYNMSVL